MNIICKYLECINLLEIREDMNNEFIGLIIPIYNDENYL